MTELPTTTELPIADLIAAEEVKNLKAQYFRYVDLKQWSRLRALFTDDAVFDGFWAAAPGPDQFVANVSGNLGPDVVTVHQGFNPELRQVTPDHIRGIWGMSDYLTWPAGAKAYLGVSLPGQCGVRGYGHYEEDYRRTAEGWRISYLRLTRIRIDPIVEPAPPVDYPFVTADPAWLDAP